MAKSCGLIVKTVRLINLRNNIRQLALVHKEEILKRYPHTWRTVAGYALNKIDPDVVNLNWLLAGSEGTLATVVQAELNLVPLPAMRCLAMVHFDSLHASLEATPRILESNPAAVELLESLHAQPDTPSSRLSQVSDVL